MSGGGKKKFSGDFAHSPEYSPILYPSGPNLLIKHKLSGPLKAEFSSVTEEGEKGG